MRKVLLAPIAPAPRSLMAPKPTSSEVRPDRRRRSDPRYPVAADVAYRLEGEGEILPKRCARSVNMSSRAILLETEMALPVGGSIELEIAWPVKLDQHVALTLHVCGRILRSEGRHTAVAILRYHFRTRRQSPILVLADSATI